MDTLNLAVPVRWLSVEAIVTPRAGVGFSPSLEQEVKA